MPHQKLKNMVRLGKELSKEWIDEGDDLYQLIANLHDRKIAPELDRRRRHALAFLVAMGLELLTESMRADLGLKPGENPP